MVRSRKRIPGGVNSPVRSWSAVGKFPRFIKRGRAAYLFDVDGKKYLDYVGSWGPLIFGHANSEIAKAIKKALERGTTFGAPTEGETELAEMVHTMVPSIDKLRLVSSGTEATMSVIRLARAYTKRDKILKFDGCYHGHVDSMLVRSGSGVATFSLPDSPGIPNTYTQETLVASFNDIDNLEAVFREYTDVIAAVKLQDLITFGIRTREANRAHSCLSARTDQAQFVYRGNHCVDHLGQLRFTFSGRSERRSSLQCLLDRLRNFAVCMAEDEWSPRANIIQIFFSVHIKKVGCMPSLNESRGLPYGTPGPYRTVHATRDSYARTCHEIL